jgi:hypothetical protein
LVESSELVVPFKTRLVVVALVVVAFVMVTPPLKVEDAEEMRPPFARMVRVVVGARYPWESTSKDFPNKFAEVK